MCEIKKKESCLFKKFGEDIEVIFNKNPNEPLVLKTLYAERFEQLKNDMGALKA